MITKRGFYSLVRNFLENHPEIDDTNIKEVHNQAEWVWKETSKDGKIDFIDFKNFKEGLEDFGKQYEAELATVWVILQNMTKDVLTDNPDYVTLEKIQKAKEIAEEFFDKFYNREWEADPDFYMSFHKRIDTMLKNTVEVTPQADATITVKGKTCTIHVDKKEGTITLSAPHMKIESARILPTPEVILKA